MRVVKDLAENRSRWETHEPTLACAFIRSSVDYDRLNDLRVVDGKLYNLVYSSDSNHPYLFSIEGSRDYFGVYDTRVRADGTVVYQILDERVPDIDDDMYVVVFGKNGRADRTGNLTGITAVQRALKHEI